MEVKCIDSKKGEYLVVLEVQDESLIQHRFRSFCGTQEAIAAALSRKDHEVEIFRDNTLLFLS